MRNKFNELDYIDNRIEIDISLLRKRFTATIQDTIKINIFIFILFSTSIYLLPTFNSIKTVLIIFLILIALFLLLSIYLEYTSKKENDFQSYIKVYRIECCILPSILSLGVYFTACNIFKNNISTTTFIVLTLFIIITHLTAMFVGYKYYNQDQTEVYNSFKIMVLPVAIFLLLTIRILGMHVMGIIVILLSYTISYSVMKTFVRCKRVLKYMDNRKEKQSSSR